MAFFSFAAFLSCSGGGITDPGCFVADVGLWCTDPLVGGEAPCSDPGGTPSFRCDAHDKRYDVVILNRGYSGQTHFFDHDSGVHVASQLWEDVNVRCGGTATWYGPRIDCEPTCSYVGNDDLPDCDPVAPE